MSCSPSLSTGLSGCEVKHESGETSNKSQEDGKQIRVLEDTRVEMRKYLRAYFCIKSNDFMLLLCRQIYF